MNTSKFFNLLYDNAPISYISKAYYPTANANQAVYFSLNPQINTNTRSVPNTASHQNFLFESDKASYTEQLTALEVLKQNNFVSTCVFSGNTSFHFIIKIAQPVLASQYKQVRELIRLKLAELIPNIEFDASTSDPCRLTRFPGAIRAETGKVQELLYIGNVVDFKFDEAALASLPEVETVKKYKKNILTAAVDVPEISSSDYDQFERFLFLQHPQVVNHILNVVRWGRTDNEPEIYKAITWLFDLSGQSKQSIESIKTFLDTYLWPILKARGYKFESWQYHTRKHLQGLKNN